MRPLSEAPVVNPVAKETPRPLWSVMIPTFNCAAYLRETLESVLAFGASPEEMQIEVVDDCSTTDDPGAVVRAIGASRVDFYQQPENVGPIRNFNTCLERSRGRLVHVLHGDDFVQEGFYARVAGAFEDWPQVAGVFTRCFIIDELSELKSLTDRTSEAEGEPTHDASWLYYVDPIRTPGVVVRREFYERHGGFLPELIHTGDWEMWVRVITRGGAIALNQPLASYRAFDGNHTGQLLRTGEIWRDYLRFGEVCAGAGLPGFDPARFRDTVAELAIAASRRFSREGDADAARANRGIWHEVARPKLRVDEGLRDLRRLLPL